MQYSINLNLIKHTNMKTTKYIFSIALALTCALSSFAITSSYYSSIDGKSGKNLFDAILTVSKTGYKSLTYDGLWTAYCAIDLNSSGKVWDMYSNATSYTCGGSAQGANYKKEGDSYNREHSIPKSWFGGSESSNTPGTDLFHVVPTDGYVNNMRSAYAFGEVSAATYTSQSGCKKGSPKSITISNSILNTSGSSTQSCTATTVFEPMDEYKGDFARGYFGTMIKWANGDYQTFTTAEGAQIFNTSYDVAHYYGLKAYGVALLLKWHREDPVSAKEIARNNGIQAQQGNRNPFIDYPCLAEYLWGNKAGETVTLSELVGTFTGSWTTGDGCPCDDQPAIILPAGDVFVGSTEANTYTSKTITVQGVNLESGLTFSISGANSSFFSLSAYSMTQADATTGSTLTIGYTPTSAGDHTATLTISGGGLASSYTIELSGTCCTTYEVTLSRNGITETVGACGTYTLPTSDSESDACDGWEFAGWVTSSTPFSENQTTAPTFVTTVNSATTLYAVYSTTTSSGGGSSSGAAVGTTLWAEDFSGYSANDVPSGATANSHNGTTVYNNGSVSYSVTNGGGTTKVYDAALATGTAPELLIAKSGGSLSIAGIPTGGATAMTLTFKTNQSSNIGVSSGTTGISVGSVSISSNTATCEITSTTGVNAFDLTITKNNGGNSREDNFLLVVKTAGTGGSSSTTNYKKLPCTTYTISYVDANGEAAGGTYSANVTSALAGTTITLDYDAAEHYEFTGWTVTNASTSTPITVTNGQFTMPAANVTVRANFTATCTGTLPTPSVTATPGNGQITLTWEDVAGASSYLVDLGTGVGYTTECNSPSVGDITHAGTTNTCVISGLVNGLSYTTTVVAFGTTICNSEADEDTTTPGEVVCSNKVNISKGTPSNGSFNLDKTGEQENCAVGGLAVHVTDITPADGYEFGAITQTGIASGVTIDQAGKTITYDKDVTGTSTINVTFTPKTTYAIRFFNNGVQVGSTQNLYVGATATLPAAQTACEGYTFLGWWTETLSGSNTTAHTWITSNFTVSEAGDKDYYAVYSHVETSGGGGTSYKLVESLTNDKDYIFVTRNTTGDGYAFSSAITTGTAVTIATSGDDKIVSGTPANSIIWTVSSGLKLTTKDESKTDKVLKINGSTFALDATGSNNLAWTTNYGLNGRSSGSTKYYLQCTSDGTFSKSTTTGSTTNRVWAYEKTGDSGSSTTYYTTMPDCEECLNKVTLTKGEESHGSFTLNKENGAYDNCKADFVVTVSGITPDDGYYCTGVTATGEHVDVSGPDGSGNYTVTYTKGYSVTSTITANFDLIPKYTVNWYVAGTPTPEEKYAGETLEGIDAPTSGDCDGVKVFKGWTAEPTYFNATDAPTDLFTDPTTKTMPAGGTNYYAVFATETTSEGSPTNVIEYDGSGMVTLEEIEGVTQNGVSTYAAGNAPYLLKFDDTGDYIQFALSAPPVSLSFNYKMLGGSNTSTMTIKECATIDGTYSSVEDLSISGAQNSTGTKTTSKSFAQKFIRMVFTKGSNVGVGAITIVGTGSSTTYSNYSTSCVTYEVTAVSNNDSWGTVSVDGYKVTASPAVGYIAEGFDITVGTATAVQNGNVFSVIPASDCTIQINFRKAAEYTVTLNDNNTSYTRTAYESTPFELPEEGLSTCPDATFLGWVAGTYEGHAAGTPVAPTYLAPGSDVSVTEDDTQFTAVYGILVENASDKYAKISSIDQLTTGDYLIVANYSTTLREAMKNAVSSGHMDESSVTITDDQITNTNTALIWRITKTGTNYTIYNDVKSQYLALSSSATVLQDEAHNFNAAVNEGNWVFESTTVSGYQLIYETYFKSLSSKGSDAKDIWIFKRQPKIDLYTSHPNCCYEPDEALAINCEVSTLIGSGSATLSLSGGNSKAVAWQCKDEADANCNSYLSGLVETEKTVTLPSAATTKTYTITAVQGDDETDPDHVICGATVNWTITVKAQFTITYKTIESGVESEHSTVIVTDGDSYTLPDISEEFTCPENVSFAGWASSSPATAVEATAGTAQTASADATWYAVWRSGSGVKKESRTKYELISDVSSLNVNDVIVLAYKSTGMSSLDDAHFTTVSGLLAEDGSYITFAPEAVVQELTLKEGPEDTWYLYLEDQYMTLGNKTVSLQASAPSTGLSISISENAAVISDGTFTLQYNSNNPRFTAYSSSQKKPSIYRKNGTVEVEVTADVDYTTNNTCLSGAVIRANTEQWITASKGQKVKRVYEVKALNFDEPSTLTIQSNTDSHFTATLAETAIPAAPGRLETTLTVEYLPTEENTANSTTITLRAGESTKTLEVNGRSLPEEFLMITKKTLWYAVPANMTSGENQYEGVVVEPDDGIEPTFVPVAPSTIVYRLRSADNSRYDANGACVRLAGNNSKALWGNTTADAITIQNSETVDKANTENYEWLLNTTDGIHYSIGNPNHADFENGRVLAFGDKFGLYKEPSVFFLVPTGCNSQPQDVSVSARRVDATFSWLSNASSMAIDVYTDEEMTVLATSVTATSVPYYMTGLNETTNYWFRLTPDGEDACSVTGTFKTTGPTVDIVEWATDGVVIFVDKDEALNPYVVIEGEVEHGMGTAYNATELFFSKYFEGSGDMKLVAIFNGTPDDISLDDYRLYTKNCSAPKNEGAIASSEFSSTTEYPISALGIIKSGQEIVFFTRPSATSTQASLSECSEAFLNEMAAKSGADEMPRWIECNNSTLYNGQKFPAMQFNGNDAICLEKNDALIDVIGATGDPGKVKNCANRLNDIGWSISVKNIDFGKDPNDASFAALYEASSKEPITDAERRAILGGFNINMTDETIDLTTARCILFRDKSVTSGERAVALNTGAEFATCAPFTYEAVDYPSEWNGRAVCMTTAMQTAAGVTDDSRATCNSYQDLGEFDYNDYYKEWTSIDGKTLDEYTYHEDTKTYDIPIDNLSKYTCLNIRFQLKNDAGEVVTESPVQVPIIVTGGHTTIDEIFYEIIKNDSGEPLHDESIDRCKTCNVVVLSDGVLTKASGSDPNDAIEVGNVKVYPGGQLIVPTGTEYTVNSLAFRRQEDEIATADIQGTLNIKETGSNVFLDLRIDPTNWHYISLPYDCKVSDIRYAGDEIKKPILGTDYLLYWYDGERRAATRDDNAWEPVTADATLKKGLGYIIGLPGEGKVMRELRFPMSNDVIDEEDDDKTVGSVYGYGCDMSLEELRPNHRGWNLIGAPYLLNYSTDITTPLATGLLVEDHSTDPWDGKWTIEAGTEALRYIVEPINNGWDGYRQVPISEYPMLPFTCYFVQIGGTDPKAAQGVEFRAESVPRSSIVRRAPAEYAEDVEDDHPVWCGITLTNAKGEKDETTMLISNTFTNGYDIMNDLVKMRGIYYSYYSMPVLASRNDEGEMAFNALPDASAEAGIPLHFFASASGTYTFAMNEKLDSEEVKEARLLDKQNGQWYDLKADSYSFTTGRTDDKERFILSIRVERKKTPEISTDLDRAGYTEQPIKILHNGHIYILRGDKMYDITGKQMLNH